MSHAVAIIEGLLALEQGVKSITVGYGQVGSLTQDIAAIKSLRELSHEYFGNGFDDYEAEYRLPTSEWAAFRKMNQKAFAIISWGAAVAGCPAPPK